MGVRVVMIRGMFYRSHRGRSIELGLDCLMVVLLGPIFNNKRNALHLTAFRALFQRSVQP